MRRIFRYLGVFLLWNIVAGFFLFFAEPLVAIPISLALFAFVIFGYVLRPRPGESRIRRQAFVRLRPLKGPALHWTLAAIPVLLFLSWALSDVYTRLVPVPSASLNPFGEILESESGMLMITLFAVGVAPVVEEFFFRGLIQRELEVRFGTVAGILGGAGFFAGVHMLPWVFPIHLFLGAAFGYVVWATRSIWSGIILHTANNVAAMLTLSFSGEEPIPTGTLWEFGVTADLWISLAALVATGAAAVWMADRMRGLRRHPALPVD